MDSDTSVAVSSVGSFATSDVGSVATSGVYSAAYLSVWVLSKFIESNLLSKLWKTFSLALLKFFNSLAKLLCLLSAFSIERYLSCISLKRAIGSEY